MMLEKIINFCKRKEGILIPCGILVATFTASILISWSIGLRGINSSLADHLQIGKAAQNNITKAVQALTKKLVPEQEKLEIESTGLKRKVQTLELGLSELRSELAAKNRLNEELKRKLNNATANFKSKLINQREKLNNAVEEIGDINLRLVGFQNKTGILEQNQRNISDTVGYIVDSLNMTSETLRNQSDNFNKSVENIRSEVTRLTSAFGEIKSQFNISQNIAKIIKDNFESLQIAVNLINQAGNMSLSKNISSYIQPLRKSLISVLTSNIDKKISDVSAAFDQKIGNASKDALDMTSSQYSKILNILIDVMGYKEIPGYGYYLVTMNSGEWGAMKDECIQRMGKLVEFKNEEHQDKVVQFMEENSSSGVFWIGAADEITEGKFVWDSNKVPVENGFVRWAEGEPNNVDHSSSAGEDCVELRYDSWNDNVCTANRYGVCQLVEDKM